MRAPYGTVRFLAMHQWRAGRRASIRRRMTHPFGQTGLLVSPLGLGLAALGRPGYMTRGHAEDLGPAARTPEALEAHAAEVLDAAWEAGVRYFDAARSYGEAEAFLGRWLARRALRPGDVTVGSKWGYAYTAGWRPDAAVHEVKEHSLARLLLQREETRARLGLHLSLYQIHSASLETGVLEDAAVLGALARLKGEGVAVGLSLTGARQADTLRRALEARVDGRPVFSCVQATWNVLEPSVGPALAEAHAAGWGVALKEVLANGRLTARPPLAADAAWHADLLALAREAGATPDALALAAALEQPFAHVVLSGAATVAQLQENLAARSVRLTPGVRAGLARLAQPPRAYWEGRGALPWT